MFSTRLSPTPEKCLTSLVTSEKSVKSYTFHIPPRAERIFLMTPGVQIRWKFFNIFFTYKDILILKCSFFLTVYTYLIKKTFLNFFTVHLIVNYKFCLVQIGYALKVGFFKIINQIVHSKDKLDQFF